MGLVATLVLLERERRRSERLLERERAFWRPALQRELDRKTSPEAVLSESIAEREAEREGPKDPRVKGYGEHHEMSMKDLEDAASSPELRRAIHGLNDEMARRGIDPALL